MSGPAMQSTFPPSYTAPVEGLAAWAQPDASVQPAAHIQHRVEMHLLDRYGDWARVECRNGWQAWVDARALVPLESTPARPRSPLNPAMTTVGRYTVTLFDLLPAVGVVLGALLPWLRGGAGSGNGFDVPLAFLYDTSPAASPVRVGMLLAAAALIAAAAPWAALRFAAYAIALAAFALYVLELKRLLDDAHAGVGVGHLIGSGVYVGIAAAGLGMVRSLVSGRT